MLAPGGGESAVIERPTMERSPTTDRKSPGKPEISLRWVLAALGIAMAVHAGLEATAAPAERAAEIQRWGRDLAALADERRQSVTDWLHSACIDAESIAGARRTEKFVQGGPGANGEASSAAVEELLDRFARPRGADLAGIWVVGPDGSVMASDSRSPAPDAACLEAASKADVAGRSGAIHNHDGKPVIPVAASVPVPGASALFAFAAGPLFARLARRATQPKTLESYLVRSRDGRLEFLSPLLFGQPAAGAFDDPRLGARAAAEGRDTFGEGLDYRVSAENTVLTVTRAIPGTDWGLAVEVDVSEALAPLRERVRSRRILAIGIWIGILGMAYGAARAQRAALTTESARVAARYVALIDEANDALVVLDDRGRVMEANRRASEFYGRTRDALIGMQVREVLPPEARTETDRRLAQVLKEGSGLFDAVHVRADGTTFPVEVSARLVTGPGAERRVIVVVRDVTSRRADADRIRRLNRMLRTLSNVNELLVRGPEEQHLFDEVCRISVEQAGFMVAWIGLADRTAGRVKVAAAAGAHDFLDDLELHWDGGPLAAGPTGTAIREGRTVALGAFDDDGRGVPWSDLGREQGFGSCAATPIRRGGEVTGTLTLYSAELRAFDPELVGLMEEMAADIGFALTTIDNRRRSFEADEKARETETRFRTFIEKAPLAIGLSREGTTVYANEKFLELWRYRSNDDVVGRSVLEHWAQHVRPLIAERIRRRALGLPTQPEDMIAQRSDGTMFPAHLETVAVELPDGPVTAAFITDETERKRAEEALRESELRLRQIAEGIDQVVWLADAPLSRLLYVSPASIEVYGRAPEELYADPSLRLAAVHPDDAERVHAAMETKQARGDYDESYRIVRPDGTVRSIRERAFPLRNADGEVYRVVGVSRDVTHERALLVAKDAAEQASRAKSSFLAHISHEIRTPMNAVLGYAQLLLRDDALGDPQRQKVEVIHSSGSHLLQVLNDVLEMSKIEAGRASLTVAPFDLRGMLADVESMFRVLTAAKGIALEVECDASLPRKLEADGAKIKQVVINLLSNAVKFTESGKIALRASCTPAAADRQMVRIGVEDTGIGIDAEGRGRLFQTFEQLAAGARIGGTGLGLAISRNFAQLMRGDVTVQSTPGAGSLFMFTFEAKIAEVAPAVGDLRGVPVRIAGDKPRPKILVVDDIATNRAMCSELLSRVGFETRDASNGEEAVAVHETWHPELVLMDLRMPGMNGFDATRRLRASGSKARIVALTASGLSDAEPEALGAGADLFLRKPYDDRDLLRRIGELLGLQYEYKVAFETSPAGARERPALSQLVQELPADILRELREAAKAARARRIEEIAKRVSEHSEAAAAAIGDLMRHFRYDLILDALRGVSDG
jgi:PAS domain S-box-containing protein